jgi:tetratricopeptide (TPR) repeat protein
MRNWIGLIGLALCAPAWAEDKPVMAPPPGWVVPFAAPKGAASALGGDAAKKGDAPVALLHLDQQVRFGQDADERYVETAVKILTPQGLPAMGTIAIPWKPDSSTLTIHKLRILRGGQTIDLLANGQQFTVLRRESKLESAILDGVLTAAIQPEGIQVGDTVEMAFTLRYRDPVLRNHSELVFEIPPGLPDTEVRFAATWPSGMAMTWRKTDAMAKPRTWQDKAGNHLSIDLVSLPPLVQPKNAPSRFMSVRRLEFTSFRSWADFAATMVPLYNQAAVIPPGSPLAAEVAKIRANQTDPKRRAEAALALVQDRIRYVFQGMDTGNLMPANAADTWSRRFGDCKGKTALLLALLHALQIEAEPAVVSSAGGDGLDARLPMAALFDHILVRARIDGKTYWLDGTRTGDVDLDRIVVPPFRWAFPIHAGSVLEPLVQRPLDKPGTVSTVRIDASKGISLPAPATVVEVRRGDDALQVRTQLSVLTGDALDKTLKEFWKGHYKFITAEKVSAAFDDRTGEETLTLQGSADLDWAKDSYGYELDGARVGWDADYKRETGANMDAPVAIGFPYFEEWRETILLPQNGRGFVVEGADVDKTLAGYALSRHTAIKDGVLTMTASSRAQQAEIPYAEALAATDPLKALGKVRVWVKAPDDYAPTDKEKVALLEQKPADAAGYMRRGNAFLEGAQYDKAIADFTQVITLDDNNALAFADRGIAHAWNDETDKALNDLDKAAAINPRLAQVFHGRAIALQMSADIGGAIAALSRAIDLEKDNQWALGQRAGLYLAQGARDKALADTDAMLKIQADNVGALYLRARIQGVGGDRAGALATLDKLAKFRPDSPGLAGERAYVLVGMGKTDDARALFADLRVKAGKDANLLNEICWKQAQANFDLDRALADCEAALKVKPEAAYLDSAGLVLLRLGRFDEAIDRYTRALAKMPNLPSSLFGRGIAERRKGAGAASEADLKAATAKSATVAADYAEFGVAP